MVFAGAAYVELRLAGRDLGQKTEWNSGGPALVSHSADESILSLVPGLNGVASRAAVQKPRLVPGQKTFSKLHTPERQQTVVAFGVDLASGLADGGLGRLMRNGSRASRRV